MADTISTHLDDFNRIVSMIQDARLRAYAKVNEELITLYYNVGRFVSQKVENAEWGAAVVDKPAQFICNLLFVIGYFIRYAYELRPADP